MSHSGSKKAEYCLSALLLSFASKAGKVLTAIFLAELRIEIPLTIRYFKQQAALSSLGVKANHIYRTAGLVLAAFGRPGNGEFTTLSGISRVILASLLLSMLFPLAAMAYSYDELVSMVQAEEKAFGKANFDLSLDQRLDTLEKSVIGYRQSGSDSYRLRAICKKLGMEKNEGPTIAAPYSVEIVPVANDEKAVDEKISGASVSKSESSAKQQAKKQAKAKEETPIANTEENTSAENTFSSVLNTNTESTEPNASEAIAESGKSASTVSKEIPAEQKSDRSGAEKTSSKPSLPVLHLPVPKLNIMEPAASTAAPAAATTPADSINSAAQSTATETPSNNVGIFAAIFGFLAIVLGAGLFFFIRNKDEQIPFGHRNLNYDASELSHDDEQYEEYSDENAATEEVHVAQLQEDKYGQEVFYIDRSFSKKVGRRAEKVSTQELDFQPEENFAPLANNEVAYSSHAASAQTNYDFQAQGSELQISDSNPEAYVPAENQITLRFSTEFEEAKQLAESIRDEQEPELAAATPVIPLVFDQVNEIAASKTQSCIMSPEELYVFGQDFAADLPFNLDDSVYLKGDDAEFVYSSNEFFNQSNVQAADTAACVPTELPNSEHAALISECHNVERQILEESQNALIPKEFTSILDLMSAEQLDRLLDEFIPSTLAMDTEQEFNILTASGSENEYNEFPPLLSVNVSNFWTEDPVQGNEEVIDTSVPFEWPAFEPEVAPRIFSVSTFVREALKDANELIGCSTDPAQRELEMLLATDCLEKKDEWGGESYRALAQLLIDAANQVANPAPQAVAAGVPLSGKRMMVAHLTGRKMSAEYENSLRQLFSEKC